MSSTVTIQNDGPDSLHLLTEHGPVEVLPGEQWTGRFDTTHVQQLYTGAPARAEIAFQLGVGA